MDSLLEVLKRVMVYYRNNPEDEKLCIVARTIKDVITGNTENNSKILVQVLEDNIPGLYLGKLDKDSLCFPGGGFPEIWQFICSMSDILIKASKQKETALIYDISDMLQGIPDFEYWNSGKNMRSYWKCYVHPVKRKWKLSIKKFW